jgi:hypothetical protein
MLCRRFLFVVVATGAIAARAQAQPTTHPLWAATPSAPWEESARAQFEAAVRKRGLGAPEVVPLATPQPGKVVDLLEQGTAALHASNFVLASAILGEAASQATTTGGEGLTPKQLASVFFSQAVALQAASGATLTEPMTNINPDEAKAAYWRAALVDSKLGVEDVSPLAKASWRLAVAAVGQLPKAMLTVHAHPRAMVSVDARPEQPSSATESVPYGEHLIRVTEPGHVPWSTTVTVAQPKALLDVPATELLSYDAKAAAEAARTRGAAFALVGQLHLGDKLEIDVRLVDARTGDLLDSTAVPVAEGTESPALNASVLRLDELADRTRLRRRTEATGGTSKTPLELAAPPPRIPPPEMPNAAQPQNWFTQRWPLFTAVAVAAGTSLVLGIVVAKDR